MFVAVCIKYISGPQTSDRFFDSQADFHVAGLFITLYKCRWWWRLNNSAHHSLVNEPNNNNNNNKHSAVSGHTEGRAHNISTTIKQKNQHENTTYSANQIQILTNCIEANAAMKVPVRDFKCQNYAYRKHDARLFRIYEWNNTKWKIYTRHRAKQNLVANTRAVLVSVVRWR